MFYEWHPYVPVAQRRKKAARLAAKLAQKGRPVRPVQIEGRTIASSFWGKAWCDNLESYSDYANRMPRGRTYVRNGSVVDLQIAAGRVDAIVSGTDVYQVEIELAPLDKRVWRALVRQCAGQIGSMIELLQGHLSHDVMQIMARPKTGLFPSPKEIQLSCTCPDWATMCKHVAAAMYGVGARLDREPEIFFTLRQVDQTELVSIASTARGLSRKTRTRRGTTIAPGSLSEIFGIEMDDAPRPRRRSKSQQEARQRQK